MRLFYYDTYDNQMCENAVLQRTNCTWFHRSRTPKRRNNKSKMTMTTITSAPWSMLFNQRSLHLYILNFFQTHQFISQMTILLSPSSLRSSSSLASLEGWVGGCRRTDGLTPAVDNPYRTCNAYYRYYLASYYLIHEISDHNSLYFRVEVFIT